MERSSEVVAPYMAVRGARKKTKRDTSAMVWILVRQTCGWPVFADSLDVIILLTLPGGDFAIFLSSCCHHDEDLVEFG